MVFNIRQGIYSTYYFNQKTTFITINFKVNQGGGEIAQSLVFLSIKGAIRVRAQLDLLVTERWNSVTLLLIHSHQC